MATYKEYLSTIVNNYESKNKLMKAGTSNACKREANVKICIMNKAGVIIVDNLLATLRNVYIKFMITLKVSD